ncbi:MAG TPA: DUF892 family protein, partial [Saprospiraceae bacterium]|nr:DUF892 family protein [Saprospiraceae bacterium]
MAKTSKSPAKKSTAHSNGSSSKASATKSKKTDEQSGESAREELMKLFEHALKDIYWVEKTLTKAIPKMIKKATSDKLIEALEEHLEVTEQQASKLERVFEAIDKAPRGKKCVGMEGILKEGDELMTEFEGPAIDAAIIAAAQKVEHYEISSYNGMITLARTLDLVKEADILQSILNEEEEADRLLGNIAITAEH